MMPIGHEIRRITGAHTTMYKGLRRGTFTRMVWRPPLEQTKREMEWSGHFLAWSKPGTGRSTL